MTHDENPDPMWARIGDAYHVPGETPTEAMWEAITQQVGSQTEGAAPDVIDLSAHRAARRSETRTGRLPGWGVAAAAVLVLGIGIGRMTVPAGDVEVATAPVMPATNRGALALAAQEYLGRTESLLTMVRADARAGRVDPAVSGWARDLLEQTRLLLDTGLGDDATTQDLMLDLELILIQIAAVTETGSLDDARARTELELTLRSLEDGEVMPRLQAAMPAGMAGT